MPLLIDPDTNERVHATRKGAQILRERGYEDARPTGVVGGPAGVPIAEGIIVDNLRAVDWDAASPRRIAKFLASGGRRYAQAVLEYEQAHQDRQRVVELIRARLNELPAEPDFAGVVIPDTDPVTAASGTEVSAETAEDPEADQPKRPAKQAGREKWDAYAQALGLDPENYSSKDDLIAAVDEAEQE